MDPLAILNKAAFDDRITKVDEYIFKPYNSSALGNSDEIRIPIQTETFSLCRVRVACTWKARLQRLAIRILRRLRKS